MNRIEIDRIDRLENRMCTFEGTLHTAASSLDKARTTLHTLETNHLPHIQAGVDELKENLSAYETCVEAQLNSLHLNQNNLEEGLRQTNKHLNTMISILGVGLGAIGVIVTAAIAVATLIFMGVV